MPIESLRPRRMSACDAPAAICTFACFVAYRNPVSSTMNEAPRREPDSIVNACSFVSVPAPKRLIAVAATGEPESTK